MKKKILIVEDEKDPKRFLELLFNENGFETATASDGKEALEMVKSFNPDIVTLDIIMPEQSGVKFYRDLKKGSDHEKLPVIIITGVPRYKDLFKRDYATMPKPFAFMEKPIDGDALVDKVREALK
jgi:DNA-binding response OmpR family regulator